MNGSEDSRTDAALLELLLTYPIPQQDVRPLAERLLARFGSLEAVLQADPSSLCEVDGIKGQSATLLKAIHCIRARSNGGETSPGVVGAANSPQPTLFDLSPPNRVGVQEAQRADPEQPAGALATQDVDGNEHITGPSPKPDGQRETDLLSERADESEARPETSRGAMLFGQAVLAETIALLPRLPDTDAISDIKLFLKENLHFSGEATRYRRANAIVRRFFPRRRVNPSLRRFARSHEGAQELRDVCFYLFCRAEPLMRQVMDDLILPSIGSGSLERSRLRHYLVQQFPMAKKNTIEATNVGVVDALMSARIARADRKSITFAYRRILLPSLAFVVHSEFTQPGTHKLEDLEQSWVIRAMLWNPEEVLPALYELRNRGVVVRVSEIDWVRQFTTRWTLDEFVDNLQATGLDG